MSFIQSPYVLHFDGDHGVLELFDAWSYYFVVLALQIRGSFFLPDTTIDKFELDKKVSNSLLS